MKICARCNRTEEEARLFDGIYINEPVNICERCALLEGVPIVKLPSTEQLRESEQGDMVYKRLRRMIGFKQEKKEKNIYEELREIEKQSTPLKKEEEPLKLVENFHWKIQQSRRLKKITQKQLADAVGESEAAIRIIERGRFPEDALNLIRKLEQFLQISIIKESTRTEQKKIEHKPHWNNINAEDIVDEIKGEPIDISEKNYLKKIKLEEENDMVKEAIITEYNPLIEKHEKIGGRPLRVLDFKSDKLNKITIADLREMQKTIEKDFPAKSSEEVGREQMEGFGKEKLDSKRLWFDEYRKKKNSAQISGSYVPSIHELAEKKQIQKKEEGGLTGRDIEIEDVDIGNLD